MNHTEEKWKKVNKSGCEYMGCEDYKNGECHYKNPVCKYREFNTEQVNEDLLEACKAFVKKLEKVEQESLYVWQLADNHNMGYTGVNYGEELKQLKQAISRAEKED